MAADLIDVVVIGHPDPTLADRLAVTGLRDTMAHGFTVRHLRDDGDLDVALARRVPHVVVTFGAVEDHARLAAEPLEIRRRWVHIDDPDTDPGVIAGQVMQVFVDVATRDRFPDEPLVSVFTPVYRTGDLIVRAYRSLRAQTYTNWEWVVYDDSPAGDDTVDVVRSIARADHRVRLFRADGPCGIIGEVKRRCCGLARGSILVELDHDDELTPECLWWVVDAFRRFPEAGFAYTDCAEVLDDGSNASYGETFAFGFGTYRQEQLWGRTYMVTNYPSINSKTIRHIVSVPNHVRAWTRTAYDALGGHAPEVHVADDYELILRTFLATRMVHISKFGYVQHLTRSGENTQRVRNKEIQRLVWLFQQRYEQDIRDRFDALGVADFIRTDEGLRWDLEAPAPTPLANCEYP